MMTHSCCPWIEIHHSGNGCEVLTSEAGQGGKAGSCWEFCTSPQFCCDVNCSKKLASSKKKKTKALTME